MTQADRAALAAYCQSYGRWVEAERKLAETPVLLKTPAGYVQPSPWLTISSKQLELMAKFMAELGLTPSSRSRLAIRIPTGPKPWEFGNTDEAPSSSTEARRERLGIGGAAAGDRRVRSAARRHADRAVTPRWRAGATRTGRSWQGAAPRQGHRGDAGDRQARPAVAQRRLPADAAGQRGAGSPPSTCRRRTT